MHLETQHGIYWSFVLSQHLITENYLPVTYLAILSMTTAKFVFPIPGCARTVGTKYGLHRHFRFLHPHKLFNVPGKGCYPPCDYCEMQVNPSATGHQETKACKAMHVAKLQREAVSNPVVALDKKFYAYG